MSEYANDEKKNSNDAEVTRETEKPADVNTDPKPETDKTPQRDDQQ